MSMLYLFIYTPVSKFELLVTVRNNVEQLILLYFVFKEKQGLRKNMWFRILQEIL